MDRSSRRAAATRRPPYANSTSPSPSAAESPFGRPSTESPVLKSHSWRQSSQPAAQPPARRNSRTSSHHEFTFSTPDGHRDSQSRRKSKGGDAAADSPAPAATSLNDAEPEDGPTKGGHSLRRRARVNYATEHVEDEVTVPNSSSAAGRQRRQRRLDGSSHDDALDDDLYGSRPKRRGASLGVESPSNRRRNPSRKSVEARVYTEDFDGGHDTMQDTVEVDEIHDTIQVGNWSTASISPSSKSDAKDNVTNKSATPETLPPRNQSDADHPAETPSSKTAPIGPCDDNTAAERSTVAKTEEPPEQNHAQDHESTADPSQQQVQVESVESQHGVREVPEEKNTGPAAGAGALNLASPRPGSKSPPSTTSPEKEDATIESSPDPLQGGSPMDVDTRSPKDSSAVEPRRATPSPVDPRVPQSEESQADKVENPSAEEEPGMAKSSPKSSIEGANEVSSGEISSKEDKVNDQEEPMLSKERRSEEYIKAINSAEDVDREPGKPAPHAVHTEQHAHEPTTSTPLKEEVVADKQGLPPDPRWCRPQPTPVGRWSHLTPYVEGQYSVYPERKAPAEEDEAGEDQTPEDKDSSKDSNDADAAADDPEEVPEGMTTELPTLAVNTPTRGSPVPEAIDLPGLNSPAPAGEENEDAEDSEPSEPMERTKHYRYRKLRDPEEFIAAIDKYEDMSTPELYEMLEAVNLSLVGWQEEWTSLGKIVDDYENATRRRIADAKYETRTRNLNQHGINHEEPEFVVRGYKAKERETMSETRYLQAQDRIMAAAYGFEYDPHPSKIGRQNPETQQAGVTTRGRSLRNQPRQTVKASEADGVAGKRQRKPVQLFDPAPQEVSRSSTPVPTRARRRKNANADGDDVHTSFNTSFNDNSDGEASTAPIRRKRGPKPRASRLAEDSTPANGAAQQAHQESPRSTGRRGRQARAAARDEDYGSSQRALVSEPRSESMQPGRRMLTLKIPRGKNFSEPSSAITDNGDSRPSTASSDSTSHTIESSYSFRPKRQKRFRDEPDDKDGAFQGPPKKRNRRVAPVEDGDTMMTTAPEPAAPAPSQSNGAKRGPKIKLMRPSTGQAAQGRNGTPVSQPATEGAEEPPKEYRAMTKSEKMSASMKSRWANGNMAGAVEKRKATLAAKKAAQAAAEQRLGLIAPKPKGKAGKKGAEPLPGENPVFMHAHPPPPHPHIHPQPRPHQQPPPPPPHPHPHPHAAHPPHPHPHPTHPHSHPPAHHPGHHPAHPPPHAPPPHPHHPRHSHPHHPHQEYPGMGTPFRTS